MQVAIVTGASSGIGFGCATKLAEARMAVVGAGRDEDRLAELEKAIGDPDRVATIAVDLTADDGPQRIVDLAVERWGHIDFLINNAGVGSPKPLHETDDESLDYFLGLMLRAPIVIVADQPANPGGLPKFAGYRVDIPNNHLQYAFTWFGLAATLLGVYLVYHVKNGRLKFS